MKFGMYAEDEHRLIQFPLRQMLLNPCGVITAIWYLFFPRKRINEVNQ